jgi:hypothetical protein
MRKLLKVTSLFALALVFTAGMAFGQNNTAEVDQNGDQNTGEIEQFGAENESYIDQVGDKNIATALIVQSEDGQSSLTKQTQLGNKNVARITGASGKLKQSFTSSQYQDGHRNFARVENVRNSWSRQKQVGNDNVARADGGKFRGGSTVEQLQDGDQNTAVVTGPGGNKADVYQSQSGNKHTSRITEYATNRPNGNEQSVVDVRQFGGDKNVANADYNSFVGNDFLVRQNGSRNSVTGAFGSVKNTADVTQIGNDNSTTISQSIGTP